MVGMMELQKGFKKAESGVIPNDWDLKSIGFVSRVYSGGTPNTSNRSYYGGEIKFIASGDLNKGRIFYVLGRITKSGFDNSSAKMVPAKTLLIAMYGATAGVSAITEIEAAINQAILAVIPNLKEYDKDYIFHWWQINKDKLVNTLTQGGQPNLSGNLIKSVEIPFPPTKAEQTAIATALNDADALITHLEKLITKKRAIKQGAMQELLRPKEGWEVKTLGEVAKFRRGSFPQPYGLDKWYDENGFPFIQVYDVDGNMKLKPETKRRISEAAQKMSVFVEKGSILLTIQGSIGRIAITQYDAYVDRTLLLFESYLIPFDKYFFMMTVFVLFEQEKQKAPGGTIKTITKEALSSFTIHYPKIEEQTRISKILSNMDKELEGLEKKLEKYKMLKQGMMQNLLTGKVRLV